MDADEVRALAARIRAEVAKAVVGQDDAVEALTIALLAGGHVLLEGPPGVAKTLLAQSFARSLGLSFGRIQFTPDLMPGDIVGSNLFDFRTSAFTLTRGPIFCEILLGDEINRTPPKTQAALLEAMQERQVTIDGATHSLGTRFTVIATQNPIEQHGTYPLPEAQLDRFLFKHVLAYPSADQERLIVGTHGARTTQLDPEALGVEAVADGAAIEAAAGVVAEVRLSDEIVGYIVELIRATRDSADLEAGASPRAGSMLAVAARAKAVLEGRDYVIPDDVKALVLPALRHRLVLAPTAAIEGRQADHVLRDLIERVAAPR